MSLEDIWMDARHKPPNDEWVEVLDRKEVRDAMAVWGRDGVQPHWQLRDGTVCHPSRFSKWRYKPVDVSSTGEGE